jgi:RNA polymerase sigma factor (sigma-70 family)
MSTIEFNHLISTNAKYLRGFAYNFTRNTDDADDLLQDTLLKAMRYKDHFQDGTNFRGWLFTIMRNIFINDFKRKKLRKTMVDQTDDHYFLNYGRSSEDTVSRSIHVQDIHKAINRLSAEYKKPFQMFLDGYHYDEIAADMSIPMGTVKSRIFHARKRLMNELKDFH